MTGNMTLPAFSLTWLPLLLLHSSRQEQNNGQHTFSHRCSKAIQSNLNSHTSRDREPQAPRDIFASGGSASSCMSGRPLYSALGALDSVSEISQSVLIGSSRLSHERPSLLNNLVAATSLAFLVAAAGSHVNSRSGRNEEALQAIRLDRVYLLFVVGCTSS